MAEIWKPVSQVPAEVLRPTDLSCSKPPLTIVCGAPGSGKTTYVKSRKGDTDVVIDLGEIMQEFMPHKAVRTADAVQHLERGLRGRNERLRALAESSAPAAWFIVGAPTADEREAWADMLGAEQVVVMKTHIDEVLVRTDRDPDRNRVVTSLHGAIFRWWFRYTPSDRDLEIITPSPFEVI